jgi:hypothetical protein
MRLRQGLLLATLAAFAFTISGCGGSSNTPPPATVTVSLSGQPASLAPGLTASIAATVSNGTGVNWTVTCAAAPCGSFNPSSTASGVATVYTAPASPTSVTITATTSSGTTAAASATITIAAPAISVTINNPPASIAAGATASLAATVANDTANAGVNWTVTCSSSSCGSFNPTKTASGAATVYTAPSAIPTSGTVTVTATSVTDTTKSASATITITAPGISVALNPTPPTSLVVGATSNLIAIVSNDSKNAGVTWTVTCGTSGACGSFSSTSTASGTATIYTAPTAIPTNNTVTITATSVTDTTKTATATITITQILANGTYIYHFSGYDGTGPSFFVGAFTVAGGVITAGEQDFSDAATNDTADPLVPSGCTLSVTGNTIQVVLQVSSTTIGVNGIETLRGVASSSSRLLISEFDTFGAGTGSIDLQTSAAGPSGGYAFAVTGWDLGASSNSRLSFGGILNVSGSTIAVGNSVFDYNLEGSVGQDLLFASGSVTAPDSFGRVTFTLNPSTTSGVPNFLLTGYTVSTIQIQLVESQTASGALDDDLGGMALGQKTTQFSAASIANTTYVHAASGEDVNNVATFAGSFVFGSSGSVTGNLALNDFTNFIATPITSGTYTVDITGRVTVSNLVTTQFPNDPFSFQLYLDGNGNAMEIGADSLQFTEGQAYLQTATSADYEGSYAIAGQGVNNPASEVAWSGAGPVAITSDALAGSTDYNTQGLTPSAATPLSGTETSTTTPPTLSVTGIDSSSFTSSRGYTYFPIDTRRFVAIETDGNQMGLLTFEGVTH